MVWVHLWGAGLGGELLPFFGKMGALLALGTLAYCFRGDGLLLAPAPLDRHAAALHPGRQLVGGALGDLVQNLLDAVAHTDLLVVRRVEHEDVAALEFELVAVRARRPVDGAVALALVAEAAREGLRVANRSLWSPQGGD